MSPYEPLDDLDYLNTNSIHDKFLTKQDHNQTQVEIPIVDFLAEQTIIKLSCAQSGCRYISLKMCSKVKMWGKYKSLGRLLIPQNETKS